MGLMSQFAAPFFPGIAPPDAGSTQFMRGEKLQHQAKQREAVDGGGAATRSLEEEDWKKQAVVFVCSTHVQPF
jgi:hypothetical protein